MLCSDNCGTEQDVDESNSTYVLYYTMSPNYDGCHMGPGGIDSGPFPPDINEHHWVFPQARTIEAVYGRVQAMPGVSGYDRICFQLFGKTLAGLWIPLTGQLTPFGGAGEDYDFEGSVSEPVALTEIALTLGFSSQPTEGWSGVRVYDLEAIYSSPSFASVCFPHNPNALTNGCIEAEDATRTVTRPDANPSVDPAITPGGGICVIGNVCLPGADPGADPQLGTKDEKVHVPVLSGYFEATAACGFAPQQCRVTLPSLP